jgi:lipopolysaccharide/colanic/teichoic acid biosynthesis glycosyltransferase
MLLSIGGPGVTTTQLDLLGSSDPYLDAAEDSWPRWLATATLQAQRMQLPTRSAAVRRPSRPYLVGKWLMDKSIALTMLVLLAPLFALVALAIKFDDRGPVFFVQQRTGAGGRRFRMIKFRTMCVNAEELKAHLQHLSLVPYPEFKLDPDPRVTRVGRVLRKCFVDELPQLLNVVRGDMSLVGPRPTAINTDIYSLWHTGRLEVKPGITGLWQIERGGGECDFDERVRLDLQYVRTRTLRGDLSLLVRTAGRVRRGGR